MKLSFTYSRKHTFYFVCLAQGTPSFLSSFGLCLLLLMLWVRILISARCTTLCDKVCQWLATGRWFSSGPPVSSTNKTDRHDITEILLKVALNTIKQIIYFETYITIDNCIHSSSNYIFVADVIILLISRHWYYVDK
jgi:hypothetical protein